MIKESLFFIIFALCCSGCMAFPRNQKGSNENDNFLKPLKVYIYPTGTMRETYVLELNSDGILSVSMGSRRSNDINSDNFLNTLNSKERKLESSEVLVISDLLKDLEITEEFTEKMILDDSWEVTVCYNNKMYNFDFWEHETESIGILIRYLIEYSPIKVDIHDWA